MHLFLCRVSKTELETKIQVCGKYNQSHYTRGLEGLFTLSYIALAMSWWWSRFAHIKVNEDIHRNAPKSQAEKQNFMYNFDQRSFHFIKRWSFCILWCNHSRQCDIWCHEFLFFSPLAVSRHYKAIPICWRIFLASIWCVICENQLRITSIKKLNVRQPHNFNIVSAW